MDALTNYPSAPTDVICHLDDTLPEYFNFSLFYTLQFHFIKMINVSDKTIVLDADTLLATVYFPCKHLYLHEVSDKMLKDAETYRHDCLHANLHQTVARYFSSKARQTDDVASLEAPTPDTDNTVSLGAHVLHTDIGPTLPDISQDQPATSNEEADIDHDQKQLITADKVTAFNDVLCPAQIIS